LILIAGRDLPPFTFAGQWIASKAAIENRA